MIDVRELAYIICVCFAHSISVVRDAVQLSGLAARVHRALIGPLGTMCPRSDMDAAIRCFAITGVIGEWA